MINVLIPTKGRPEKLLRCVNSIDVPCELLIAADSEKDIPDEIIGKANVILTNEPIVYKVNELAKLSKYDFICSADDCVFIPGMLQKLISFNDNDCCVVGFKTANMMDLAEDSFLIKRNYYLNYGLFNKDYYHFFADTQFKKEAEARGLVFSSGLAVVNHYHPSVTGIEDETHKYKRSERWIHDDEVYRNWLLHR